MGLREEEEPVRDAVRKFLEASKKKKRERETNCAMSPATRCSFSVSFLILKFNKFQSFIIFILCVDVIYNTYIHAHPITFLKTEILISQIRDSG